MAVSAIGISQRIRNASFLECLCFTEARIISSSYLLHLCNIIVSLELALQGTVRTVACAALQKVWHDTQLRCRLRRICLVPFDRNRYSEASAMLLFPCEVRRNRIGSYKN